MNEKKIKPVESLTHTPPYKIHKYFARRPWNVFSEIIETFSNKGDVVLDPFCGGGVTLYESAKLQRRAIGFDLNPLSIFLVRNMVSKGDNVKNLFNSFNYVSSKIIDIYDDGYYFYKESKKINIDWIETTFEVICPGCKTTTLLSNEYKTKPGFYKCKNISCEHHNYKSFAQKNADRTSHKYLFLVGYDENKNKVIHAPLISDIDRLDKHILKLEKIVKARSIQIDQDLIPINWDRQKEDILERKNIVYFQDFFTYRNLLILNITLEIIKSEKSKLSQNDYELLRIAFSNTVKETNIMSFTSNSWQSGRPTSWSKHAYWIPSQFCEVNILNAFLKSVKRVKDSLNYNKIQKIDINQASNFLDFSNGKNFYLCNNSLSLGDLPDNSVDSIITDPPYGSNVQYLELSHFWFPWNKDLYESYPDFKVEAVSNRKKGFDGAKSMYTYEKNLLNVFQKCYSVLKPDKYLVMTFNNKDFSAWLALLFSVYRSGFSLEKNGIYFQDGVKNYRQTAHTRFSGSPYGDFIYIFKKEHKRSFDTKAIEFNDEIVFSDKLDEILERFVKLKIENKNELIVDFLKEALPLIEGFSKTYLKNHQHSLYTKFDKKYLNRVF
ncbi:DNA methyltransferase [Candidatus Pseudothioglobus singularis]|nr:DNA methyltransferase [Candidatus Pseudothioglobus singularis]